MPLGQCHHAHPSLGCTIFAAVLPLAGILGISVLAFRVSAIRIIVGISRPALTAKRGHEDEAALVRRYCSVSWLEACVVDALKCSSSPCTGSRPVLPMLCNVTLHELPQQQWNIRDRWCETRYPLPCGRRRGLVVVVVPSIAHHQRVRRGAGRILLPGADIATAGERDQSFSSGSGPRHRAIRPRDFSAIVCTTSMSVTSEGSVPPHGASRRLL